MGNNAVPTGIQWRKSSYSSDQGGECIECAALGQLAWRKSTYSGDQGGDCIEIAETTALAAIRDSKTPAGPILTVTPAAFTTFVNWTSATAAG